MSNTRFCKLNIHEEYGKCYSCKYFQDYGPMSRFGNSEGKCEIDNHEVSGGLLDCTINKYEELNYKDVKYL